MTRIPFRELPDAGLWRRLAAALYDGLLILALWFAIGFTAAIVGSAVHPRSTAGPVEPLVPPELGPFVTLPLLWLVTAGFYGWFWRHGGQTLGMKTWRLRLVTADDRPLGRGDCLLRSAVGTLSWLAAGAGYLWLLRGGRTWHDLASRTRVVVLPKDAA
ncbi:MAG: RDD family protein [Pseudomonadota bacterium]